MVNTKAPTIFVSYARPDVAIVRELVSFLESAGLNCWFDEKSLIGGQDWKGTISDEIKRCGLFVTLLSRSSIDRRGFFHSEMKLAIDEAMRIPDDNIFVLPIRLDDCIIPRTLSKWHVIDLFDQRGIDRLLTAIGFALKLNLSPQNTMERKLRRCIDAYTLGLAGATPFELSLLDNNISIIMCDPEGRRAIHERVATYLAMRDGVEGYTEHMSADGGFTDAEISPGNLGMVRREGGDLFARRNFGCSLNQGDVITQRLKHTVVDSFLDPDEGYWSIRIVLPSKQFTLKVVFHELRPYESFTGLYRVTSHENPYEVQPDEIMVDNKRALIWRVDSPNIKDVYKLAWTWKNANSI